jgi:hypothetical protein
MSRDELRRALDKRLKTRVPSQVWDFLVKNKYVSEALTDHAHVDPIAWLAAKTRELLELRSAPEPLRAIASPRRQRRQRTLPLLREVISDLVAARARTDSHVRSFRSQFLPAGLLGPGDVVNWIETNVKNTRYDHAAIVDLPKGTTLEMDANGWRCEPPLADLAGIVIENPAPTIVLQYAMPNSRYVHRRPVGRDGVLRTLADLSASLASTYSWQPAQATMFVLTDSAPTITPDQVAVQRWPLVPVVRLGRDELRSIDCLMRFVITVDSRVTPEEVAKLYKEARAKHLKRTKTLKEKQMLLASFASQYPEVTRQAWADWNRAYPKWKFHRYSNFARDIRAATDRLLFTSAIDERALRRSFRVD